MNYGTTDGVLKLLDEVLMPDPRFKFLVVRSAENSRQFELADLHGRLSDTRLSPAVPDDVRRQIETARNLMLYAWFVFEFQTIAELQAYLALELALRRRLPEAKREQRTKQGVKLVPLTLSPLLKKAVAEGLIVPEKLPAYARMLEWRAWHQRESAMPMAPAPKAKRWLQLVMQGLPTLRNTLAHGLPKLDLFSSLNSLELCADLINALFPATLITT